MTAAEITNGLTQTEYERLLNRLAEAIQTQRRFITILSAERVNSVSTRYTVKCKSSYYPYLLEDMGFCVLNWGLII